LLSVKDSRPAVKNLCFQHFLPENTIFYIIRQILVYKKVNDTHLSKSSLESEAVSPGSRR